MCNELVALHRFDEAERHLKTAMDLFPSNPVIGFVRAEAFYNRGTSPQAIGSSKR